MLSYDFNRVFVETEHFLVFFVAVHRGHSQVSSFDEGEDRNVFRHSCKSQM